MYTKRPQKNNGTIQGTLHSLLSAAQNGTKIWYYRTYSPDGGAHVRKIHRRCSLSNWEILLNYFNPAI